MVVGELAEVLKEAKIYHKCLRIQYLIRTEELLSNIKLPFKNAIMRYLPINYAEYDPKNEFKIVSSFKWISERFKSAFEANNSKNKRTGLGLNEILLNLENRMARMKIG